MREGVGVENSLRWVAARFAQRAVEDFFEGSQDREFVIDAATAVEFTAKCVVSRHDVTDLYELIDEAELTPAQRLVLNPRLGTDGDRPIGSVRDDAMAWLLQEGKTISAAEAVRKARKRLEVDVSAGDRLIEARNAAVHLGDVDPRQRDKLARDFIKVIQQLWTGLEHNVTELWGDFASIADAKHMKSDRTPVSDAEVRVVRARRAFFSSGLSGNRRSRLPFVNNPVHCPACGQGSAIVTTQPVGSAPEACLPRSLRDLPVEVLDCPVCGLALFGTKQITWAEHAYPRTRSEPWRPSDHDR